MSGPIFKFRLYVAADALNSVQAVANLTRFCREHLFDRYEIEIVDLLVNLNRELGQTFVLVTHDTSVARRAHRLVRMRDGVIESDEQNSKEDNGE